MTQHSPQIIHNPTNHSHHAPFATCQNIYLNHSKIADYRVPSRFVYTVSKSLLADDTLTRISRYTTHRILVALGHNQCADDPQVLFITITHSFKCCCYSACLILSELLHSVHLIDRMIENDIHSTTRQEGTVVRQSNVGTLLLCSVMLSIKYNRDIPFTNSWWSKTIGVPLGVLAESELVFLKSIHFDLSFTQNQYHPFFTFFLL